VFALFNIEYCYGEDLTQLYWGFWSVLQVGSNIAIFGVMLQLWIVLGNVDSPSWAVALGTPVLVFAALGWIFREVSKHFCRRLLGRTEEDSDYEEDSEKSGDRWISRAYVPLPSRYGFVTDHNRPTIVPDGGVTSISVSSNNLKRSSTT